MTDLFLYSILLMPLLYYTTRGRRWHFLDPINTFWLAYVHFGFIQPTLERETWINSFDEATFQRALLMFVVLGGAVIAGQHSPTSLRLADKMPVFGHGESRQKLWRVALGVTLMGLVGYAIIISASGGWDVWSISPRAKTNYEIPGWLFVLPRLYMLGLLILMCYAFTQRGTALKVICTILTIVHIFWMTYSGTREGALVMIVVFVGSIYGTRRRNPPILVMVGSVMLAGFLFAFIANYRDQFKNLSFIKDEESFSEIYEKSMDFYDSSEQTGEANLWAEFGMVLSAAYYIPGSLDYDYGYMLLEPVTRIVPRALWPGKIYPESVAWDRFHRVTLVSSSENMEGYLSGPSPSMVGKYYYILGWPGLILGGFISGMLLRALWEYVLRYDSLPCMGAILMISVSTLGAMEMTHPLSWSVNIWIYTVGVPLLLMLRFVRPSREPQYAVQPSYEHLPVAS